MMPTENVLSNGASVRIWSKNFRASFDLGMKPRAMLSNDLFKFPLPISCSIPSSISFLLILTVVENSLRSLSERLNLGIGASHDLESVVIQREPARV